MLRSKRECAALILSLAALAALPLAASADAANGAVSGPILTTYTKVNLNFAHARLGEVMEILSEHSGRTLDIDPGLRDVVISIQCRDTPWEAAVADLSRRYGFVARIEPQFIRIGRR